MLFKDKNYLLHLVMASDRLFPADFATRRQKQERLFGTLDERKEWVVPNPPRQNIRTDRVGNPLLANHLSFIKGSTVDFTGSSIRGLYFDGILGTVKQDVQTANFKVRNKGEFGRGVADFSEAHVVFDNALVTGLTLRSEDMPNRIEKPIRLSNLTFAPESLIDFQGILCIPTG